MNERRVQLLANFETGGLNVTGPYGTDIHIERDELRALRGEADLIRFLEPRMRLIERMLGINVQHKGKGK